MKEVTMCWTDILHYSYCPLDENLALNKLRFTNLASVLQCLGKLEFYEHLLSI
jgi:hypothetical protein